MILALNECHLRGPDLNKTRRQIKTLGWRCFVTPACDKHWGPHSSECRLALGAGSLASDLQHAKRFHNSGGEMILCNPLLAASGYRQPEGVEGFRSIIYRASGCSIFVVCAYFLPGIGLDCPPNQERCSNIRCLIDSLKIPWLIVADWNRSPEEVGSSYFAKYLGGAVVAPTVLMTCSSTADGGEEFWILGCLALTLLAKCSAMRTTRCHSNLMLLEWTSPLILGLQKMQGNSWLYLQI